MVDFLLHNLQENCDILSIFTDVDKNRTFCGPQNDALPKEFGIPSSHGTITFRTVNEKSTAKGFLIFVLSGNIIKVLNYKYHI